MKPHVHSSRLWLSLSLVWWVGACTAPRSGTETDNPVADTGREPPPPYESPERFGPDAPGVPPCLPPDWDSMPRRGPRWAEAAGIVALVNRDTLTVLDTTKSVPERAAQVELRGDAWFVAAHGSSLAIVMDERPALPEERISAPAELEPVKRLIHYDVNTPAAPRRLGDVPVEGELWDLQLHDGQYWVLSALTTPTEKQCGPLFFGGCGWYDWAEIVVQGYAPTASGWAPTERLSLPMTGRAWASERGFVSVTMDHDDQGEARNVVLHAIRIEAGQLEKSEVALPFVPQYGAPVGFAGQLLLAFESDGTGASTLHVFDVRNEQGVAMGTLAGLPEYLSNVVFGTDALWVSEGTNPVVRVDLSDPTVPVLSSIPGVSRVLALPAGGVDDTGGSGDVSSGTRLLGWGNAAGGALQLSLLGAGGVVTQLATGLVLENELEPTRVDADRVVLTYQTYSREQNEYSNHALVVEIGSELALHGPFTIGYGEATFAWKERLIAASANHIETVAFESGVSTEYDLRSEEDASGWLADAVSIATTAEWEAFLTGRYPKARLSTRHRTSGTVGSIEVSPVAERVMASGKYLLVLAKSERQQCEQTGLDCTGHVPHVAVYEPGVPPTLVSKLPLPAAPAVSGQTGTVEHGWNHALPLGDEWIFVAEERTTCLLRAECEELGIEPGALTEVNVAFATSVDCPPGVEPCVPAPTPPPPEVYGSRARQIPYRLKLSPSEGPAFVALGGSTVERAYEGGFAEPRVSGRDLLITRIEGKPNAGRRRFMLDRISVDPDGSVVTHPELNIPGYPIAFDSGSEALYTVEPTLDASNVSHEGPVAQLHRLSVDSQGAYVETSRELSGRYEKIHQSGKHLVYLRQGRNTCDDGELSSFATAGALEQASSFTLPGPDWWWHGERDGVVLLTGPHGHVAVLGVNEETGAISLLGYRDRADFVELELEYGVSRRE